MAKLVLEDIQKKLLGFSGMSREPADAYQIVCDYYYDFIENLVKSAKTDKEKAACSPVVRDLQKGTEVCCLWVTSGQCMTHFKFLSRSVQEAINNL